jgi:hypothetical protein
VGTLRELGVGLCRGNATMYRVCLGQLARASGQNFVEGLDKPTVEVGVCCHRTFHWVSLS